jgi:hypothetical protein
MGVRIFSTVVLVALLLEPASADAYCNRGVVYCDRGTANGRLQEGRQYLTEAIRLNSKLAKAYAVRGRVYQLMDDGAKSDADLAKAKALGYQGK